MIIIIAELQYGGLGTKLLCDNNKHQTAIRATKRVTVLVRLFRFYSFTKSFVDL
jgi:hypothetical protein